MEILEIMQSLEPIFIEAGQMAKRLRSEAEVKFKGDSGVKEIDIVTSSDLAVQEFILQKMLKTDLQNCQLVAEEDTPSRKLFAEESDLVITLDPIDGTYNYANGLKMYSVIVSLNNKKEPLYTFDYFPEFDWGFKIVNNQVEFFGDQPKCELLTSDPEKVIGFANHRGTIDPPKTDLELYDELSGKGFVFKETKDIGNIFGSVLFFVTGMTGGYYIEHPSAVDGLTGLHFAIASGCKLYNHVDLSAPVASKYGGSECYGGYYVAVREE